MHEHSSLELLTIAPDDDEQIGVDQWLKPNHHQCHRYQVHEPDQELTVTARHECYARNVHDQQYFRAQLQVLQFVTDRYFLIRKEGERVKQLVEALWQAVASNEKVVDVYAKDNHLQEIQPATFLVQIFIDEVPPH